MRTCVKCGTTLKDNANFCSNCRAKVVEVCNCWVLGKPYNCGYDDCPGRKLYVILVRKEKLHSEQ